MLTLYGTTLTRTFRVMWMLEELGLPYEHVKAGPQSEKVRAVSPLGKVPVLVDDGAVIPDSTAIMTYLADKHGQCTFAAGTPRRGQQDALTFRILDEIDAVLWTSARHSFVLPEDQRVPAIKESLKGEFARNIARLTDEIEGPYLMGETFTVPDILLCHCAQWSRSAKFPEAPPALADYLSTVRARPAFQRAAALREA
ncbi:MAG: glutathione S-transferase family protein [Roseivivax sp.]|nr:glutathione S-transferase family protein [Roseivivax sp.]